MKAILVINIPTSLEHLLNKDLTLHISKKGTDKYIMTTYSTLRPMPEKKETFDGRLTYDKLAEYIGSNKCIDEILGEKWSTY